MPQILWIGFHQLAHRMRLRVKTIHVVGAVLLRVRRLWSQSLDPTNLVVCLNIFWRDFLWKNGFARRWPGILKFERWILVQHLEKFCFQLQFLSRLTLMFDKARSKGHVQLTMKRCNYTLLALKKIKCDTSDFFFAQMMAKPSQLQGQKIKRMPSKVQRQSRDQSQRHRITQIRNSCVLFEQLIEAKKLVQW